MRMNVLVFSVFTTTISLVVHAQSVSPIEAKVDVLDTKGEISSFQTGTKGCLTGSLKFTEGGHRWTVGFNNGCGRVLQCNVTINLKANNGQTGSGSCNPSVPQGNTQNVCSAYNANIVWISGSGNVQCK